MKVFQQSTHLGDYSFKKMRGKKSNRLIVTGRLVQHTAKHQLTPHEFFDGGIKYFQKKVWGKKGYCNKKLSHMYNLKIED